MRRLFRIIERDELDRLGAAPEAELALALKPGIYVTADASGAGIRPTDGASHGYLSDFPHIMTGLVAAGAGIREGTVAPRLDLVDVAPLVAYLLGLEMPPGDGILPMGFLEAQK